MKAFDKHIIDMIDKLANKESLDDVKWGKVSSELFNKEYTPAKYKNMHIRNEDEWIDFVCYYSMQKAQIDAYWIAKRLKMQKPGNNKRDRDIDLLDEVFNAALKEINSNVKADK